MAKREVGKITHYFSKIGVAVVELTGTLKVGDRISIEGKSNFEQVVNSMQIEKKNISSAGAGQAVGLKVDQPVKEGDKVYVIEE
jgi:putative protease